MDHLSCSMCHMHAVVSFLRKHFLQKAHINIMHTVC